MALTIKIPSAAEFCMQSSQSDPQSGLKALSSNQLGRCLTRGRILEVNSLPRHRLKIMSTSLKASLPIESSGERSSLPGIESVGVYNLMVLVRRWKDGGTSARAANLPIPEVRTETVREALSGLVTSAREVIADCIARDAQVPWIAPPIEPDECESRFLVPLHL